MKDTIQFLATVTTSLIFIGITGAIAVEILFSI